MNSIRIYNELIYVSYDFVLNSGITNSSIKNWTYRDILKPLKIDGVNYIPYDSIPEPSRKKLPSREEIVEELKREEGLEGTFYKRMLFARDRNFKSHLEGYMDSAGMNEEKAFNNARFHAVFAEALAINTEYTVGKKCIRLRELYNAFCRIYPNKYEYTRFSRNLKESKIRGVEWVVTDKRGGSEEKYNAVLRKWAVDAMSSGKAYTIESVHQKVKELCAEYGFKAPGRTWVVTIKNEYLPSIYKTRYGEDKATSKLPYAGIIRAQNPGDQWQIDGWRMPFYMQGYRTLTIFGILDACTGRMVGYCLGGTENTELILKGLENAVETTGILPHEIVSDNHSFNKTKEADYFKAAIKYTGCEWTVSSNPRYKAIVERSFQTFGTKFCKDMYGYIGEGIRTRRKDGRTSQELIDKYTKSGAFLEEEHIQMIAIDMINSYNDAKNRTGISPNEKYEMMKEGAGLSVNLEQKIKLFIRRSEYTVERGQINIIRSGVKYEFQLNSKQYAQLNDKKVGIRYVDFDEIYLFDLEKDVCIGSVPRKRYAHGAKVNQTEEDILLLNKNKGRLSGIKSDQKKKQIELAVAAEAIDPEAAHAMNRKLTPKCMVERFEADGELRREAERRGIHLDVVPKMPVFSEVSTFSSEGKKKRRKESPFSPQNHTISIVDAFGDE